MEGRHERTSGRRHGKGMTQGWGGGGGAVRAHVPCFSMNLSASASRFIPAFGVSLLLVRLRSCPVSGVLFWRVVAVRWLLSRFLWRGGMVGGLGGGKCLYGSVMELLSQGGVRGLMGKEGVAPVAG